MFPPLRTVSTPTRHFLSSDKFVTTDLSLNKDGIVQENIPELNTSVSPSLLVIDDSDNGDGDDESVQVVGITGTFAPHSANQSNDTPLPGLSSLVVKDLSGATKPTMEIKTPYAGAAQTTSPRFTSFLMGKDTPMNPGNLQPPLINENPEVEEEMETTFDSRPADTTTNESSAVARQSIVVTRQEILALTNVLGSLPQSALTDVSEGATGGIQLSVIEGPPNHLRVVYKTFRAPAMPVPM